MRNRYPGPKSWTFLLLAGLVGGSAVAEPSSSQSASVDTYYGAFSTSEPITVPAFHGLEPSLRLTYSSSGGSGVAGAGWSLEGFSTIVRASPGKGTPRYDGADLFVLDGQELVACAAGSPSPSCTTGGTHATRIESYQRIQYNAAANTWTVWRKDGTRQAYVPLFQTAQGTYRWGVSSVVDTSGNTVSHGWWCDGSPTLDCYPDSVSYNGTVVRLYREWRPDASTFANGSSTLGTTRYRLKTVDVVTGGTRVRAYKLSYTANASTGLSLLASVQQFGRDATLDGTGTVLGGSAWPATSFSYDSTGLGLASAALPPSGMWSRMWDGASAGWPSGGPSDGGVRYGDFDGDGRQDALWMMWECKEWFGSGCQAHRELWLNKATGWVPGALPPTGGYFALNDGAAQSDGGLRVADINGDGKSDLVWSLWECTGWYGAGCQAHRETWLSTGNGWVAGAAPPGGGYFSMNEASVQGDGGLQLADINGDGKSDLVWSLWECTGWYGAGCQAHRETWLSTGNGWVAGAAPPGGGYFAMNEGSVRADGGLRLADIDGDGKSDLLWSLWECTGWYGEGCQAHRETWLSTGDGWRQGAAPAGGGYFAMHDGAGKMDGGLRLADINGDGKSDLVWSLWECTGWYGEGCQAHRETWLSTGSGWAAGPAPAGGGYFTMNDGAGQGDGGLRLSDVNGDGRSDLVWSLWECTGWYGEGCQAHRETWLSTGSSWAAGVAPGTGGYFAQWDGEGRGPTGLELVDLDGDGAEDLLWQLWECTSWFGTGCQGHREAVRYTAGRNLLNKVTNGLGGTTAVEYIPSSVWSNTYLPVGAVLQTVSAVSNCDGRGNCSQTRYNYQGGLWSSSERRFLGFRKVTSVLDAAGNYTETYYHQHVGCISKPEVTYYRNAAGSIFKYSTFGYAESASAPFTSLMTERWEYECNLSSACRRTLLQIGYDQYGNGYLTYEHGDYDVAGDERTSLRGLYPNTGAYVVGMPAYENIYAGIGTGGTLLKQTLNEYDGSGTYAAAPSRGRLTRQRAWNNQTGGYVNRSFGYDTWGNLTSETDERGYTRTMEYDATYHVQETKRCNALGQCSTKGWDGALGLVKWQTDINGNTTSYTHDALGRPLGTVLPDGSTETFAYLDWGNPWAQRIRRAVSDGTGDGLWMEMYEDGLGRKYKTVKEGGFVQETQYSDGSTRVWKKSAQYGPGETPRYQVFSFDGLGRLRTITNPDGTLGQRVYGNGYVISYDELNREKVTWTDAYGQTTQVREKNGSTYQYTTYQYDLLGNLVRVTDAAGNASTVSWDSLGRKLAGCDPDTGCSSYTYDEAGHILTYRDAKGQVSSFTYDALGRRITKTLADGKQARWTYDEAGHGAGKGTLTSVVEPTGSESRNYDSAGRVTSLTKCVSGVCYTSGQSYDVAGRLSRVTYPDGEVVTYGYDTAGRLGSVSGYVNTFTYNGRGQLLTAAYANGTTARFTYADARQWMTESSVAGPGGTVYQASYGYDAGGRVTSMSSATNPLSNVSYGYDALNRLTSVSGNQSQGFAYDALGNMTWNSQVGNYQYADGTHRHAATLAGANTYSYDANGHMVSGGGRTLTWDADNRLASVTTAGGTTTFVYDATGQRVVKSGPSGTTRYFGALVELGAKGFTKNYYAGPVLVAKRDATGPTWLHQDHLGSVRAITNQAGQKVASYDYSAFGATLASSASVANSRGYGGHEVDETGLVYMNARYYDPQLGRFISPDALVPSSGNPQALNRYAYVYNNPISNTDPTGHVPVVAAIATAVSVGVATSFTGAAFVISVVGAATVTAGYVLKDPMLMSIGGVLLGAASAYTFGAGFLGDKLTAQAAWAGGSVSALTSPVSPLDPQLKQAIGLAYTAQSLFHEFKNLDENIRTGADQMRERLTEQERATILAQKEGKLGSLSDANKALRDNPGSWKPWQRQYGDAMERMTQGALTAGEAIALNPSGGLVGPGDGWMTQVLEVTTGWIPGVKAHGVLHDAAGFLAGKDGFGVGPGYLYLGHNFFGMSKTLPVAGQVEGIAGTGGASVSAIFPRLF
ncbi:toxin TcdB middle/N-terminal domain-containing protein [Archangium violaceum]|uniref:toxin TcdB middle/N-terminal domain-containing protein n=1 Tax=Archangium violaceum TaxID=83451 RepID=UPI002B2C86C4|nr:toxin TcdB middle/N-terminal domain-containing protein [Archangium gephyra]